MRKPVSAQFEISEGCNYRCEYCYNFFPHSQSEIRNRLSLPVIQRINRATKELVDKIAETDIFSITITGGEPLDNRGVLYYALEKFRDSLIDVSINSNLSLLRKEDAKFFRQMGVRSVLASFLGPNAKTHDQGSRVRGSFYRLTRSLEILAQQGVRTCVNLVVTKKNVSLVYETGVEMVRRGVSVFAATPVVASQGKDIGSLLLTPQEVKSVLDSLINVSESTGIDVDTLHPLPPCMFNEHERERYARFYERRGCVAAVGTITFSPTGDVRVCSHDSRSYGNILHEPLEDILQRMEEWRSGGLIPAQCTKCAYVEICRGACRVSAEALRGELNSSDIYFAGPVPELQIQKPQINETGFSQLAPLTRNFKVREDAKGVYTVYANPLAHATLNEFELSILRRFLSGATYEQISSEVNNQKALKKALTKLLFRHILRPNKKNKTL
ncbi:radical SAM protein [Candidatus Pacearchaeota archaeon]|nr:MAG: radical SAM protein [Candidatus Pacearchaeota archaeon]